MQPVDNLEVRRKKRMKTFYLTDAGKVRSHNEDSVTILKNDVMLVVFLLF